MQSKHPNHPQTPAGQLYRCYEHGCDPNINVFKRRDHHRQHLRCAHKLRGKFIDLAAACHDLGLPLNGSSSPATMTTAPGSSDPAEAPSDLSSFTGGSLLQ
ncbi:hypothetical protein VTJ04DRAFT_10506 [Mycothermus thermophilus]|uniref:uncharacterized protein n=1 Tax=Humicola insolens TaxID=85995 RepID=UPI0037430013